MNVVFLRPPDLRVPFKFPITNNINMAAVRTCKTRATLTRLTNLEPEIVFGNKKIHFIRTHIYLFCDTREFSVFFLMKVFNGVEN
jgi:hypothetical protein